MDKESALLTGKGWYAIAAFSILRVGGRAVQKRRGRRARLPSKMLSKVAAWMGKSVVMFCRARAPAVAVEMRKLARGRLPPIAEDSGAPPAVASRGCRSLALSRDGDRSVLAALCLWVSTVSTERLLFFRE